MFLTQFTMVTSNVAGALAQHVQLGVKPLSVITMILSVSKSTDRNVSYSASENCVTDATGWQPQIRHVTNACSHEESLLEHSLQRLGWSWWPCSAAVLLTSSSSSLIVRAKTHQHGFATASECPKHDGDSCTFSLIDTREQVEFLKLAYQLFTRPIPA